MQISVALLCDAVTAREGLLNILAGGITRTTHPSYPAQFEGGLALRIMVHPTEAQTAHAIQIILQDADGKRLAEINGQFQSEGEPKDLLPGEELSLPLAMNFQMEIPNPGQYSFEVLIDNIHQASLPFRAVQAN